MKIKIAFITDQQGQTLIETLVAIFILITGLVSALSLAIYSFKHTDSSSKQIVATALARQGVEAVKNMRDTNWLNDNLADCSSYFSQPSGSQYCYKNWLGSNSSGNNFYALGSSSAGSNGINYTADYDSLNNSWSLNASPSSYALYYDKNTGNYSSNSSGLPTIYSRMVNIVQDFTAPFNITDNPRLIVTATVWWHDGSCPSTTNPNTLPPSCKVVLVNYLTNWRNY